MKEWRHFCENNYQPRKYPIPIGGSGTLLIKWRRYMYIASLSLQPVFLAPRLRTQSSIINTKSHGFCWQCGVQIVLCLQGGGGDIVDNPIAFWICAILVTYIHFEVQSDDNLICPHVNLQLNSFSVSLVRMHVRCCLKKSLFMFIEQIYVIYTRLSPWVVVQQWRNW